MKRRLVALLLVAGLLVFSVSNFEAFQPAPPPATVTSSPLPVASAPTWNLDRLRGYIDGYFGAKRQQHPCAYISHGPSSDYNAGVMSGYADATGS